MANLICAGCGHENRAGARFCESCGGPLARVCLECGAPVSAAARFCDSCGATLSTSERATAAALKTITVVFSDLAGSTALQEALDPESVRRVMARYYEAMRAVVAAHEGSVEKFIGDAVVAVFGTPISREDDALRAVRCAAVMASELETLNDELERSWGVRLRMRTGVNTGELVVSDEGILVGDTMNTAARLEQAAGAGEVLIGGPTARLVRHAVDLEEVEPLALKGKSAPVRAWRVLAATAVGSHRATAEAPLIGRREELARLRSALAAATETRACSLVSVIGSPGLGKSRLAQELASAVRADATVLFGHCEPSGEGITFVPVAEVLRSAAGIGEADPPELVRERLRTLVGDGAESDLIVRRAAAVLGAGDPASAEETFWGVRRVLEAAARRQPLLVVLDDVHWGQPMFLDLIEHLVEWVRDAPILLVALARPELREIREALASAGRRPSEVIELEPLDGEQSRELVGGLLGAVDLPPALLERMLETTEGNPLFLSELLRMLVDDGALVQSGEAWVAAGGADAVQVPPTIQALLTARIERLRADERTVVERAAVIGKQFYRGAVAELVAPPVRTGIDGHLETLRRKDMVEPEGTYWIDEPVYRFHHVLIRDAAYRLLLKEARAELHEKFADWLATKAGELVGEHEEVIAYHLEQAHEYRRQLGPLDDRGRALGERAASSLASAGRRALAREDLAAAANLLQRSLDRDAREDATVLWDLAEALLSAGDPGRADDVVHRLATADADRAAVLEGQLSALTGTGSLTEVLERTSDATAALADRGDGIGEAKGHHVTAQLQALLGRVADVESSLDRALVAARRANDRRRVTAVLAAAPRAALWGPSPVVRASGRCLDIVRILRMSPGNRHVEAVALRCQAVLEAMRGRADAAREIVSSGRATLEELGLGLELQELAVHAGIVELLAGDPAAAAALLHAARDGFESLGIGAGAAQAAALLGRALVEQGRPDEAIVQTEFAEEHAGGDLKTTITWLGVRAEALAQRGALDDARALARRAVALADPTDALADKADAYIALARVEQACGDVGASAAAATSACELYEVKDHVIGAQRAREMASAAPDSPAHEPAPSPKVILGSRPPERVLAAHNDLVARQDTAGLTALGGPGAVITDHRPLGLDAMAGSEQTFTHFATVFAMWPDLRFDLEEVIACDERAIAFTGIYRGTALEGGGEATTPIGVVWLIENEQVSEGHVYELEDRAAITAKFKELAGGPPPLGDRPPERLTAEYMRLVDAHDVDGLAALYREDCVMVDHRPIATARFRGPEGAREAYGSMFGFMPDYRFELHEVLACDDSAMALRGTWVGTTEGVELEGAQDFGIVISVRDGQYASVDLYPPDDRTAILARYAELSGGPRNDTAPERWYRDYMGRWNGHDQEGSLALLAESFAMTDRRSPSLWDPVRSREEQRPVNSSAWSAASDARMDVEEVIACDDRVIALRLTFSGTFIEGGGPMSMPLGVVSVIEDQLHQSMDVYDPDDRVTLTARYAELGGGLGPLGDTPPERWLREFAARYTARARDRVLELAGPGPIIDHRALGWEGTDDVAGAAAIMDAAWAVANDLRIEVLEVLAADDRLLAVRFLWSGTSSDGGGALEIPMGLVVEVTDGCSTLWELFDIDDREGMLARYRELGGRETHADPGALAFYERFAQRWRERDVGRLLDCFHEDYLHIDHRNVGWEGVRGLGALEAEIRSSLAASPDLALTVKEIIDTAPDLIAMRAAFGGHSSVTGGEFEEQLGYVAELRDGRIVRTEWFPPEATISVRACFAERRGLRLLGKRPPEQALADFIDAFGRHDRDGLVRCWAEHCVLVDRRSLSSWGELPARDAMLEVAASGWGMAPDLRMVVDEVLACDDRLIAFRGTYIGTGADGGGLIELEWGWVNMVENGHLVRTEGFDPDDRVGMLTRYAELGGGLESLADSAPERWWRSLGERSAAHDRDGVLALFAEPSTFTDHRTLPWESEGGVAGVASRIDAAWGGSDEMWLEVDEVLACDERAIAIAFRWRGSSNRMEWELPLGVVTVIEDGKSVRWDQFEHDDRQAMLGLYRELAGAADAVGPPVRALNALVERYNERDVDGLVQSYATDWVMEDHRDFGGELIRGREGARALLNSIFEVSPDNEMALEEVVACDDRVAAFVSTHRGTSPEAAGGPMELRIAHVVVWDGTAFVTWHMYDPDDRAAILARYHELSAREQFITGRRAPARLFDEFLGRLHAARFDELGELVAEDWYWLDHRALGWDEEHGRDRCVANMRSLIEGSPGVRVEFDEVLACDERVLAVRMAWRGHGVKAAELEVAACAVFVVEAGQWVSAEFFEPDDPSAAIARFEELSGGGPILGDSHSERAFAVYVDAWRTGDPGQLAAVIADDVVVVDHRPGGWPEARGRESYLGALHGQQAAIEIEEVVAAGDRVIAVRATYKRHSADGPRADGVGQVCVIEDRRIRRADFYPPGDRDAMLARFAHLTGADQYLDDTPMGQLFATYMRAFTDHDLETFVALHTEDVVVLDHRQLGWPELRGRQMVEEFTRSAFQIAPTARFEVDEILARDDTAIALRGAHRHEGGAGIGPVELRMGYVSTLRHGMIARLEVFDYDDADALLSRFRELSDQSPVVPGDRPIERALDARHRRFNAHEIRLDTLSADFEYRDHRALSGGDQHGREETGDLLRSIFAVAPDVRVEVEVIASDEHVIATRSSYRGTNATDEVGAYEVTNCEVWTEAGGELASVDLYDDDERGAAIARFVELGGGLSKLGDTQPERLWREVARRFSAHDLDGLIALYAEGTAIIDHRKLAWESAHSDEDWRTRVSTFFTTSWEAIPDLRPEVGEVLAASDGAIALVIDWRGTVPFGGGEFLVSVGVVNAVESGQFVTYDQYEPESREAMLARFAELSSPGGSAA